MRSFIIAMSLACVACTPPVQETSDRIGDDAMMEERAGKMGVAYGDVDSNGMPMELGLDEGDGSPVEAPPAVGSDCGEADECELGGDIRYATPPQQ